MSARVARDQARVLVIGAGGLGAPAAIALARAGVGAIVLHDDDEVALDNLHRQILFGEADVGRAKVAAACERLTGWKPAGSTTRIVDGGGRFLPENAAAALVDIDVVVEGSDNFATKFLVADACQLARVPVVQAAALRWGGNVLAVGPDGGPCYRCVFEDVPSGEAPNCAEVGVIGPVVGVLAALQVDLALALLDGRDVAGTAITFDGKTGALRRRVVRGRPSCALCGTTRSIQSVERARYLAPATPACTV